MSSLFIPHSDDFQAKAKTVEQQYSIPTSTVSYASKVTSLVASAVAFQHAPYWTLVGALMSLWMSLKDPPEKKVKIMEEESKKESPLAKEVMEQADTLSEKQVKVYLDLTRTAHVAKAAFSVVMATWIAWVRGPHLITPLFLGGRGVKCALSLLSENLNHQPSTK